MTTIMIICRLCEINLGFDDDESVDDDNVICFGCHSYFCGNCYSKVSGIKCHKKDPNIDYIYNINFSSQDVTTFDFTNCAFCTNYADIICIKREDKYSYILNKYGLNDHTIEQKTKESMIKKRCNKILKNQVEEQKNDFFKIIKK